MKSCRTVTDDRRLFHALPLYTLFRMRDLQEGFKGRVGGISKMIWGLQIEVDVAFLMLGLAFFETPIADIIHSRWSKQAIKQLMASN